MGFILSDYAKRKKLDCVVAAAQPTDRILEIGSAGGWFGQNLKAKGFQNYQSLDLAGDADFIGDIQKWRELGLAEGSYDWIIALEVVEHVDCFDAIWSLLKPGGKVFLTSPVPHFDWVCKGLEWAGLTQKRTSPHDHLIYFENIPKLTPIWRRNLAGLSQWGIFEKRIEGKNA